MGSGGCRRQGQSSLGWGRIHILLLISYNSSRGKNIHGVKVMDGKNIWGAHTGKVGSGHSG